MTKKQFENKLKAYIKNSFNPQPAIDKLIGSGCINIEAIQEDDYTVIKAAACAIYKNLSNQVKPLTKEGLNELTNISKFI